MTRQPISRHTDVVSKQTLRYRMIPILDVPCDNFGGFEIIFGACNGRVRLRLFQSDFWQKSKASSSLVLSGLSCQLRSPRHTFLSRPSNSARCRLYECNMRSRSVFSTCTLDRDILAIVLFSLRCIWDFMCLPGINGLQGNATNNSKPEENSILERHGLTTVLCIPWLFNTLSLLTHTSDQQYCKKWQITCTATGTQYSSSFVLRLCCVPGTPYNA